MGAILCPFFLSDFFLCKCINSFRVTTGISRIKSKNKLTLCMMYFLQLFILSFASCYGQWIGWFGLYSVAGFPITGSRSATILASCGISHVCIWTEFIGLTWVDCRVLPLYEEV